ncbi:hypothetical protein P7F88_22220 [Vibrio hannami]|uniref:acyltransferase n=1 Tax=Vibrio hannami TaxID=2717094 RepID=UPI00240ED07F|nr:hypothetical protein [Vibrio hannami]MDG3088627.1 hypothetical protein [Vibrio hannami]
MKHKIRLMTAIGISLLPTNRLRVFLYKLLLNYRISDAHISWLTLICVESAELNGCKIGMFNKFSGPMLLTIGHDTAIDNFNTFTCGRWTKDPEFADDGYERKLTIGSSVLITSHHFFDIAGNITIGDNTWIAGRYSQFWTHGAGKLDKDINIGERCYVGSSVKFATGSGVGDNCIVGLGSVVTKYVNVDNAMVAGNPARVIKSNFDWKAGTYLIEKK